ncbi:S1C family serine protease, partial [Enterobacter bugandensis]|uniref:trypsin-like peptidase domain-containing protein n=1 Tax=Enterobacter bugandensis TaxID=881260 RepID=UPI0021D14CB9
NNKVYVGQVVGSDPVLDIAVIKIDEVGLPAVIIGDSSKVKRDDKVITIGSTKANAIQSARSYGIEENANQKNSDTDRQRKQTGTYRAIMTNIEIYTENNREPFCNLNGEIKGTNNN